MLRYQKPNSFKRCFVSITGKKNPFQEMKRVSYNFFIWHSANMHEEQALSKEIRILVLPIHTKFVKNKNKCNTISTDEQYLSIKCKKQQLLAAFKLFREPWT
jgi:hypothetical protein